MNMNLTMAMEGFYSLKVHGGRRGEIDFGTHKNLILDAGITHMLNNYDPLRYIHVGSGSSQPSASQAQLDARFAYTNRSNSVRHGFVSKDDSENNRAYGYSRLEVQFDKGAAKGNISEIGVGNNTDGNPLWSRTLILDHSGNPTSITILEDEYLTVTYEARRYVSTEVVTTTLEYDDDGEKKQVECKVIPSTSTREEGWGSAGFDKYRTETRLGNPSTPYISYNWAVDGNMITMLFKYGINNGNDVDISNPYINSGRAASSLIPDITRIEFNPPLRKTKEFEMTIGITVTIERA